MKNKMVPIIIWIFSLIISALGYSVNGQTVVNDKTFKKTQTGITIVEFWADWNKKNECLWVKDLKNTQAELTSLISNLSK